jgi:monoterpene epsilon-lactone hydrolase
VLDFLLIKIIKAGAHKVKARNIKFADNPAVIRKIFVKSTARVPTCKWVSITPYDFNHIHIEHIQPLKKTSQSEIMYFHGGGYVVGGTFTHRPLAARISHETACSVHTFDYRLAPENPFPAAIDDALAVYEMLLEKYPDLPIYFMGDSAGGGLALALTHKLKELNKPLPKLMVLLSPWTDLTGSGDSVKELAHEDPMIDADYLSKWAKLYANGYDLKNPLISPLWGDFSGFPPMLIQVGTCEVLRDDSVRLAEKAKAVGVDCTLEVYKDMIHVFQFFFPWLKKAKTAISNINLFLQKNSKN